MLAKAEEAIEKEDFATAARLLDEYLAQKPDDARAHFQLGYACTALQQNEKAKTHYQRAVELDPKLAAGHLNLGLVLLEQSPREAVAPLRRAVELLPDQARPRYLLGQALERSEQLEEAVKAYTDAGKIEPGSFDIALALGRVSLAQKDYGEAEASYRKALKLQPAAALARLGLAESLLAQNKAELALTEYSAYLAAKPDDADVRLQVASLCADLGRFEAALAELQRLEDMQQRLPQVHRMRALIHQRQNRVADAAKDLEGAVVLEPRDWELRAQRGRLLLELRDFPAAEAELRTALQLKPDAIDPLRDLVATFYLAENYPSALQALDQLAKRESLSPGSWFIRATCYDKMRMLAEARAAYQKFIELDQGKSEKQDFQARQRIKTLTRMLEKKR